MDQILEPIGRIIELGGPVVALLICLSVVSLAVCLYKVVQFLMLGVGRHTLAKRAVGAWTSSNRASAISMAERSKTLVGQIAVQAMRNKHATQIKPAEASSLENSLLMEAEDKLSRLERGFRLLDSIAQIAPLLGLFGTVLGMIDAFQKLQNAGNSVDPSILAGGIWVALLTTAVGLAVAMPTSLFLTFFESRVARERLAAEVIISRICNPMQAQDAEDLGAVTAIKTRPAETVLG